MHSVSVFLAGVYESLREAAEHHGLIVDELNSTRSCNGKCPGATGGSIGFLALNKLLAP